MEDRDYYHLIDRLRDIEKEYVKKTDVHLNELTGNLENSLIKEIINHPFIKIGKWLLMFSMILGITVWGVGSYSNFIQLRDVSKEAQVTKDLIKETNEEIENAAKKIRAFEDSISRIYGNNSHKLKEINQKVQKVANDAEKNILIIKTDFEEKYSITSTDSIEYYKKSLNQEIVSLRKLTNDIQEKQEKLIKQINKNQEIINNEMDAFRTLDLNAIKLYYTSLVGISNLILLVLVLISIVLGVFLLVKFKKLKNR